MNATEWEQLIKDEYQKSQDEYNAKVNEAKESAQKAIDREIANGAVFTEEEIKERLNMATMGIIDQPETEESLRIKFSFLKDPEIDEQYETMTQMCPPLEECFYEIDDGRIYDIANKTWAKQRDSINEAAIIKLTRCNNQVSDPEYLKSTLEFYKLPVGDCLLTAEELYARRTANINTEVSSAIVAGFDYEYKEQLLHFSYDEHDQQNFADTANQCIQVLNGLIDEPTVINWNGYKHIDENTIGEKVELSLTPSEFMDLYNNGALAHKKECMAIGQQNKNELVLETVDE